MIKYQKDILKKKVLVTGANGFTGKHVCLDLKKRGISFAVILRPGTDTKWMEINEIKVFFADLNDFEQLILHMKDYDYLINLASLGFINVDILIKACDFCGLKRVIFISSTSIFTSLNVNSKKVRINSENLIKKSQLNWTILRPTMIYGTERDRNMIRLIKWIDKYPFIPIFGKGENLQQPVFVEDLSKAIVGILENEKTLKNVYNISGKYPLTFLEVIKLIEEGLEKKVIKIFLPARFFSKILKLLEFFGFKIPIKSEQIDRLNEDKDFKYEKANNTFGYNPISFDSGIIREIEIYRENKLKIK